MTNPLPDRFILYRREWDAAKQKWQKIPCDRHGMDIDPSQPEHWMTYDEARLIATWDPERPKAPYGVGFYFNGDGWFFIDIDDALEADGQTWKADANLLYRSFAGALGEVSTSGNGLHIIGQCDPEQLKDRRKKWGNNDREFYTWGRFVALSQQGLSVIGDGAYTAKDWTAQLLHIVPQREFLGDLPDGRDERYTGPDDDDELITMMLRSKSAGAAFGGLTIQQLWEADAMAVGQKYPDPLRAYDASAADMALMSHLAFWTGKDMPRMERLARRSALARSKWDSHRTYLRETVQKAARLCKNVYDRPKLQLVTDAPTEGVVPDSFMIIPEQVKHFEGCVYVRDVHKVLVPDGDLLKPDQFKAAYGGYTFLLDAVNNKTTRNAFEVFTESQSYRFPKARGTCFRADHEFGDIIDDHVNIYRRPDVVIAEGDVTPFLDFLARIMPHERDRRILLSWCAALIQNPGRLFQWACVLQGVEGNGKSLIMRVLKYCVGAANTHDPRADEMGEKFNDWMLYKLLICVEEVHARGKLEMMDFLKPLITNDTFELRGMGAAKGMRQRTFNWIFCTNHRDAIIKTVNDRRYAVFFLAQQQSSDLARDNMSGSYFPDLYRWLGDVGYSHIAHYLLNYQIDPEFNPAGQCQRAPETTSTVEAIAVSASPIEAEIREAIASERVGFRGGWVSSHCLNDLLRSSGYRISGPKLSDILTSMGYRKWGRSPSAIIAESGLRPHLWYSGDDRPEFKNYIESQGLGYS